MSEALTATQGIVLTIANVAMIWLIIEEVVGDAKSKIQRNSRKIDRVIEQPEEVVEEVQVQLDESETQKTLESIEDAINGDTSSIEDVKEKINKQNTEDDE